MNIAVAQVVGYSKDKSAIHSARLYGERKRNVVDQHFWARGYLVSTVGRAELDPGGSFHRHSRPRGQVSRTTDEALPIRKWSSTAARFAKALLGAATSRPPFDSGCSRKQSARTVRFRGCRRTSPWNDFFIG